MWQSAAVVCFTLVGVCYGSNSISSVLDTFRRHTNSDTDLPTPDIVRRAGYPAESHVVQTQDGYLLTMHRIPGGPGSTAVFLQHGFLGSSADWIVAGKGKSLAFILADKGYDVWLGNARGNTYSRAHRSLSSKDSKFWDFTWHEMGLYDLPAELTYIGQRRNDKNILYVGHSMGTTMFYVMASRRPDVASRVRAMFSLAPVAFMDHVKTPARKIAPLANDFEKVAHFLGKDELLPQSKVLKFLAKYGCDINTTEKKICENFMFVLFGFDKPQFNITLLPVILGHSPAGTSTKTMVHYGQEIVSGKFREYDYGSKKNMKIYNSTSPTEYDLSKIRVPVSVHYADNDWLASPVDVAKLYDMLPVKLGKFRVDFPKFTHLDFIWGIDAPNLVYKKLLFLMEKYQRSGKKSR